MDIKEKALGFHNCGFNCAQSVLAACAEYTGLGEDTALAISAGFGGGLRSGEICGAVSGAVMALGLTFPFTDADDLQAKQKIALLAKDCVNAAKAEYGCVRCLELKAGGVSCAEIIGFMASEVERILNENK